MKRLLTLVSLLVPLTLPAQKRDNFFTDLNDFLNMRADKAYAKMDTSYIDRYPFIWDAAASP